MSEPVSDSSALGFGKPGLTGQVAGLIALALAIMLTVTRLSLRKRFRTQETRQLIAGSFRPIQLTRPEKAAGWARKGSRLGPEAAGGQPEKAAG